MIKNPKLGQRVFFAYNNEVFEDNVLAIYPHTVQLVSFLYSDKNLLFKTEQLALQYLIKVYNKQIFKLSKKREKLATKLAKLISQ